MVKGCGFCGGLKIAISHWQSQSPLTQGWRYRAARDKCSWNLHQIYIYPPFSSPIPPATSTDCPAASDVGAAVGSSPACHPEADWPLHFPGRAPPVAPSSSCFVAFRSSHRLLCQSIDGVPASAGNSVGDQPRPAIVHLPFAPLPAIQLRSCW